MHQTRNTLSENIRAQSGELLNKHLAAAIDLHGQAKQAHWNVRGMGFIAIHELFDRVSVAVENYSDLIAERVGALGGTARGTVQAAAERSFLVPYSLSIASELEHVFAMSGALAAFGQSARMAADQAASFGDANTADLFTEISRGVDQQLWFVESHMAPKMDAAPLSPMPPGHPADGPEPVRLARGRPRGAAAAVTGGPSKPTDDRTATEAWTNEGGAGSKLNGDAAHKPRHSRIR
jgi:starvation-inducible DNA-binding protein